MAPQGLPLLGHEPKGEVFREALPVPRHRSHQRLGLDSVQAGQIVIEHDAKPSNDEDPALDRLARERRGANFFGAGAKQVRAGCLLGFPGRRLREARRAWPDGTAGRGSENGLEAHFGEPTRGRGAGLCRFSARSRDRLGNAVYSRSSFAASLRDFAWAI